MENKTIRKQMEDSQKNGIQKKNKIAINFAKGGTIGIGVGIILVGGALLVNAFHKKKPPQKPTNKNHELTHHSSPLIQQHLISDETGTETEKANRSDDKREICAHKLFADGNHKFEDNHGRDDDYQEISGCSKDSEDQTMEGNDSVVEIEQSSSLSTTNTIIHQPIVSSTEDINGRRSDTIETTEVDQVTEQNHQIEEHKENCYTISQETGEEEGATDHTVFELNSDLIDDVDDQESDNNGDTVKHGQDDDMLRLESIEDSKINEIPEATHENDSNSNNTEIFESENNEKIYSHSDGWPMNIIKEEEINRTSEADEVLTRTHEGTESKGENQAETLLPEEKTAQLDDAKITEDQESIEIDVQDTKNGLLTTGDGGVSDKFELVQEPNTKMQSETLEFDEKEAKFDDAQTNSTAEAVKVKKDKTQLDDAQTKEAEVDSRIEQTSKLIKCQVMQPTRFEQDKESQNSAIINATEEEAMEDKENHENISLTLEYHGKMIHQDTLVQSTKETQLIYQESQDLSQDHLVTQAFIVAENSEGLPKLQEMEKEENVTPQEMEKEIHYKNSEDGIISSFNSLESVKTEKGNSSINFLKKYEKMSILMMRQRGPIVIGTLIWPLFYCYFGLPFLKICLIAVLVMLLSKINGF